MEFKLTEVQQMVKETAREIAQKVIAERVEEIESTKSVPQDIFDKIAEAGLLGVALPEEYGGIDAGYIALSMAYE